ncbi:MAG: class I SAM-dependent methyltransferase [Candidatus Rokubacteria bacterium]|nr:class I SAM-dependent methyltransferase [Candidatus Rokubacteria bacterium]
MKRPTSDFILRDLGTERVLTVRGAEYRTYYSERIIRMLIERKGLARAPLYFPFKETRGRFFLERLFRFLAARGARDLRVLEVGCSFGHITEYLNDQPPVTEIHTFDVDGPFVEITRAKVEELSLGKVRQVLHLTDEQTTRLPFPDAAFDLVLAVGVVEHLPARDRHRYVDEWYRVLVPGGHIAILDTPNRLFPLETHSVGLPGIQWLPPRLAFGYARLLRPTRVRGVSFGEFNCGAWRNASLRECLPSRGWAGIVDATEEAGYGWNFFRDTARSRIRRAVLPMFAVICKTLGALRLSPSLALPYFNLVFRKREG